MSLNKGILKPCFQAPSKLFTVWVGSLTQAHPLNESILSGNPDSRSVTLDKYSQLTNSESDYQRSHSSGFAKRKLEAKTVLIQGILSIQKTDRSHSGTTGAARLKFRFCFMRNFLIMKENTHKKHSN